MKIPRGYDTAMAYDGSFEQLPPGGYVCEILSAREEQQNVRGQPQSKFVVAVDIAEGDYKGYFKRQHDRDRRSLTSAPARWRGTYETFIVTPDGVCNPYFKGLIKVIEESNPGFTWDWDERALAGKRIGLVFGEERYIGNDGNPHTAVRARFARTVDAVRAGIEPPPLRDRTQQGQASGQANARRYAAAPSVPDGFSYAGAFTQTETDELPF